MTNPSLIAQDTPWRGFTMDEIVEAVLMPKGLTLSASTNRTIATTEEQSRVERYVREAVDELHAMLPNVFTFQWYEATWTVGDHSIALPANMGSILQLTFDGYNMRPITRDDYARLRRTDEEGGGIESEEGGRVAYYRVTGYSDEDAGTAAGDRDWRVVVRLFPTPLEAKTLKVNYISLPPALTVGADPMPYLPTMQRWIRHRAGEIWAADSGDVAQQSSCERERAKVEPTLQGWFEAMRELPSRARPRRPHVTRKLRYRR